MIVYFLTSYLDDYLLFKPLEYYVSSGETQCFPCRNILFLLKKRIDTLNFVVSVWHDTSIYDIMMSWVNYL